MWRFQLELHLGQNQAKGRQEPFRVHFDGFPRVRTRIRVRTHYARAHRTALCARTHQNGRSPCERSEPAELARLNNIHICPVCPKIKFPDVVRIRILSSPSRACEAEYLFNIVRDTRAYGSEILAASQYFRNLMRVV